MDSQEKRSGNLSDIRGEMQNLFETQMLFVKGVTK